MAEVGARGATGVTGATGAQGLQGVQGVQGIQGVTLELPGFWLTLSQMLLGVCELCCAASCLYALLPKGHGADPITFAATYVFACLIGIALSMVLARMRQHALAAKSAA